MHSASSPDLAPPAQAPTPQAAARAGWQAALSLEFAQREGRTVLARREHVGPLVVQRPLYEEGPQVCQAVVIHPPGGIAGGDELSVRIAVGERAHALLTTPGAARWYRSAGASAVQDVVLRVAHAGVIEWLPQETIVFDGARARQRLRVELAGDALFAGWEVTCFGRTASGERFGRGRFDQGSEILREGRLLFAEAGQIEGGSALLDSRAGLAGHAVSATLVVAGRDAARDLVGALRGVRAPSACVAGVTALPGVLVARLLGPGAEAARRYFTALWALLRPALIGRAAVPPRIWRC